MPLIENRGPDETSNYSLQFKNAFSETFTLYFVGSVLHLRGKLTKQPKVKEHIGCSDVFLWNGEVFGGNVKVHFNIFIKFSRYHFELSGNDLQLGSFANDLLGIIHLVGPQNFSKN